LFAKKVKKKMQCDLFSRAKFRFKRTRSAIRVREIARRRVLSMSSTARCASIFTMMRTQCESTVAGAREWSGVRIDRARAGFHRPLRNSTIGH
jgi:hypothetical protein